MASGKVWGEVAAVKLPASQPLKVSIRRDEVRDKKQAVVVMGFPGAELK